MGISKKCFEKKSKFGLKKKIEDLSILCGVEALMVCFDSSDTFSWPEDPESCLSLIQKYRSFNEEKRMKKTLDLSSFFKGNIEKSKTEEIQKLEDVEIEGHLSIDELKRLLYEVDSARIAVEDRIRFLNTTEDEVEILGGSGSGSDRG
ncbi:hypothetical protein HHK36_013268 [Tetracentron sinense]|uniref:MADS-box domain-containing protein n=1 Tax=Tetracentron sinense TaxID=13715 RepID=A0A834Z7E7_TETSI|nr:hypothetical protein HHK36_013268 [Tetracentron sinense]